MNDHCMLCSAPPYSPQGSVLYGRRTRIIGRRSPTGFSSSSTDRRRRSRAPRLQGTRHRRSLRKTHNASEEVCRVQGRHRLQLSVLFFPFTQKLIPLFRRCAKQKKEGRPILLFPKCSEMIARPCGLFSDVSKIDVGNVTSLHGSHMYDPWTSSMALEAPSEVTCIPKRKSSHWSIPSNETHSFFNSCMSKSAKHLAK